MKVYLTNGQTMEGLITHENGGVLLNPKEEKEGISRAKYWIPYHAILFIEL